MQGHPDHIAGQGSTNGAFSGLGGAYPSFASRGIGENSPFFTMKRVPLGDLRPTRTLFKTPISGPL